jgi:hypothetical protein
MKEFLFVLIITASAFLGFAFGRYITTTDYAKTHVAVSTVHEVRGNGFAFTVPTDVFLVPNYDLIGTKNTGAFNWFYSLGWADVAKGEIVPASGVSLYQSFGLHVPESEQLFSRYRTDRNTTLPGYVYYPISIHRVNGAYPDSAKAAVTESTDVVEFTIANAVGGSVDLHHVIVRDGEGFIDIQYRNVSDHALIQDMLRSLVLFTPTK